MKGIINFRRKTSKFINYLLMSAFLGLFVFPVVKALIPLPDTPIEYYVEEGTGLQGFIPSSEFFSEFDLKPVA